MFYKKEPTNATPTYVLVVLQSQDISDSLFMVPVDGQGPMLQQPPIDASNNTLDIVIKKIDPNLDPSVFTKLAPGAVYGFTDLHTIGGMRPYILQDAASWINTVKSTKERNIIRLLLKKLGFSIAYPRPEWAAKIGDNVCDSFKEMMDAAITLSNEKLARFNEKEYDAYKGKLEEIRTESNPDKKADLIESFNRKYRSQEISVHNEGDLVPHSLYVPNPYRASQYREALTSFADPAGLNGSEFDPSGTMFAMNYKIANELIPKDLVADKKITTAILESLWYCGNNPDLRNDPRCFASRFLGEFRALGEMNQQKSASAIAAKQWEWPILKRVLYGFKSAIPGTPVVDIRLLNTVASSGSGSSGPGSSGSISPALPASSSPGSSPTAFIAPLPLSRRFRPLIPLPRLSRIVGAR
jgi:hypothetical protein